MSKETIFILVGLAFAGFFFWFAVAYPYSPPNANATLCSSMMYSDNWTLGYLREIAKLCSNGG